MLYILALWPLCLVMGKECGLTWSHVFLPSVMRRASEWETLKQTEPNLQPEIKWPQLTHRQNTIVDVNHWVVELCNIIIAKIWLIKCPVLEKRICSAIKWIVIIQGNLLNAFATEFMQYFVFPIICTPVLFLHIWMIFLDIKTNLIPPEEQLLT